MELLKGGGRVGALDKCNVIHDGATLVDLHPPVCMKLGEGGLRTARVIHTSK